MIIHRAPLPFPHWCVFVCCAQEMDSRKLSLFCNRGVLAACAWPLSLSTLPVIVVPTKLTTVSFGRWALQQTLTTVGYGDMCPGTGLGKLVACFWMVTSVIATCVITSFVTAKLTVDSFDVKGIETLTDVKGKLCIESEYAVVQKFVNVRRWDAMQCSMLDVAPRGGPSSLQRPPCSEVSAPRARRTRISTGSKSCSRGPTSVLRGC